MSNGDDEPEASEDAPESDSEETTISVEMFESRLDDAAADLEAAETEAGLDDVEATLDAIGGDLEAADLPEPDDEDEEDPTEAFEARIEDLRDDLEAARGPYAEDVSEIVAESADRIRDTRWTADGKTDVRAATETFLAAVSGELDASFDSGSADLSDLAASLDDVGAAIEEAGLDPDADAETITALLDDAEELEAALDDAEEWSDLTVREQLEAEGFYDRLTPENRKDFPPERGVIRIAEAENDPERILLALEQLESDFTEENCLDALGHLGAPEAFEAMHTRAEKRDRAAIEVLGKIGDERAVETLIEYVDSGNPPLQRVTLRALGEIGSREATEPIAQLLADGDDSLRSIAAESLGLIGDTRAIEPLASTLASDEDDSVRASAARALNRIGTEQALETASEYADDRAYIVQFEAEKARDSTAA